MAFYITQYSRRLDLLGCSQESKLDPTLYGEGIAGVDEHTWDMWFPEKYSHWHIYIYMQLHQKKQEKLPEKWLMTKSKLFLTGLDIRNCPVTDMAGDARMKILVDEDALKEIFYMLARSTALSNKVEVVQMTKLVKTATLKLADLLDEVQE